MYDLFCVAISNTDNAASDGIMTKNDQLIVKILGTKAFLSVLRSYRCIGMKIMKNLRTAGISVHMRTNCLPNALLVDPTLLAKRNKSHLLYKYELDSCFLTCKV